MGRNTSVQRSFKVSLTGWPEAMDQPRSANTAWKSMSALMAEDKSARRPASLSAPLAKNTAKNSARQAASCMSRRFSRSPSSARFPLLLRYTRWPISARPAVFSIQVHPFNPGTLYAAGGGFMYSNVRRLSHTRDSLLLSPLFFSGFPAGLQINALPVRRFLKQAGGVSGPFLACLPLRYIPGQKLFQSTLQIVQL